MLALPPFFKEIFKHLPNVLFDLISWREMLSEITILSNRLLTNNGATEARLEIEKILTANIVLTKELPEGNLEIIHGEKILKLYFLQIMKGHKVFLDFRPKYFSSDLQKISWNPNGLYAQLDDAFLEGIRKVYKGYYHNDDNLFTEGMLESGLIKKEWDELRKIEVMDVFKKHFSNGRDEKIAFNVETFKNSFAQIFKTLVKNKIKLDKNFLYLGIMLVTLYITLNEIGGTYDASSIFKEAELT